MHVPQPRPANIKHILLWRGGVSLEKGHRRCATMLHLLQRLMESHGDTGQPSNNSVSDASRREHGKMGEGA